MQLYIYGDIEMLILKYLISKCYTASSLLELLICGI